MVIRNIKVCITILRPIFPKELSHNHLMELFEILHLIAMIGIGLGYVALTVIFACINPLFWFYALRSKYCIGIKIK